MSLRCNNSQARLTPGLGADCHQNVKFSGSKGGANRWSDFLTLRAVLEFFVPSHLDGFELAFVGRPRIALEIR